MKIRLLLFFVISIGLLYRLYGLGENLSFWSDENPVAIFTRAILERGRPILANGYFTKDQQLQYWLNSISANVFGLSEFGVRFPSVLFGTLTILATYLLGSRLFNRRVGFFASLLTALLKIEILWSRQARPYQALQLFLILGAYFIYRVAKENKFNLRCFLGFLGCGIFASLMHGLGLVVFFSGFIYLLTFKTPCFKKKWMFSGIFLFLLFGWVFRVSIFTVFSQIGKIKNLFYYRVFLTHNYLPLCLLAVLGGFLLIWRKDYQRLFLFVIFLGVQIIVISFFLGQPFVRYFYPIFSFFILLASYGMMDIGDWILDILGRKAEIRNWRLNTGKKVQRPVSNASTSLSIISSSLSLRAEGLSLPKDNIQYLMSGFLVLIVVFSLWKSDKLSLSPQKVYSLNSDMQEVPEVDWKEIYDFVGHKLEENPGAILVTNWNDLPVWYLGEDRLNYLVRKENIEKDSLSGAEIVNSLDEFINLLKTHKKGFFVLDSWDNLVPDGVREYCHKNLKRELEKDRLYPIQPRYWTVWVYSWGLK